MKIHFIAVSVGIVMADGFTTEIKRLVERETCESDFRTQTNSKKSTKELLPSFDDNSPKVTAIMITH